MVEVYRKHRVILTAIGIYSVNTGDEEVRKLKDEISAYVLRQEHVKQIHGFYYGRKDHSVRFDVVISFDAKSRQAVFDGLQEDLKQKYPDLKFSISMDMDYGEILDNT